MLFSRKKNRRRQNPEEPEGEKPQVIPTEHRREGPELRQWRGGDITTKAKAELQIPPCARDDNQVRPQENRQPSL